MTIPTTGPTCERRPRLAFGVWLAAAFLCACHHEQPPPVIAKPRVLPRPAPPAEPPLTPPALRATELARVPNVTYGPYLGMRADGGLVVWAALDGAERKFQIVPLSAEGRPIAPTVQAGAAPEQIGLVAVRPVAGGYGIVYTRRSGAGESIEALCVGSQGEPAGPANVLSPLPGRALWIETLPLTDGGLVFYAVRGADRRSAEIWTAALDARCHAVAKALVVREAQAWQAVKVPGGALLASVRSAEAPGRLGRVSVTALDESGKARGTTLVTTQADADLDLDAVGIGGRAILAWTNSRRLDSRVETAIVDQNGALVRGPEPLTHPSGEQALVRLVPPARGGQQAFVAWEKLEEREEAGRRIAVSALSDEGRLLGPEQDVEYASDEGALPEFAASPSGLAVLTLAPMCERGRECSGAEVVPTYVRFDQAMSVIASEPLRLEPLRGARAELDFGLGCTARGCFAISALSQVPAPVFATELDARSTVWRVPVTALAEPAALGIEELETLALSDSVAALAVEAGNTRNYLAFISDFDPTTPWKRLRKPAVDGRFEPLRAKITLEQLDVGRREPAKELPASPISLRAESLSGVAIARGDARKDELLVAWAGLDAGTPQVFVTLVAGNGDKVAQHMLTRKKGALGDVAATWVGDGWIVAWVDERSGDPEVYATKLDAKLNRVAPEQRLTTAAGAASDLAIAFDGKRALLAWADARGAEVAGHADIYTAFLRTKDAQREGDEQRVLATRAHSFGPSLATSANGFALAWIERGESGDPGQIAATELGADGRAAPAVMSAAPGAPRGIALSCASSCRMAVLADDQGKVGLYAAAVLSGQTAALQPVVSLEGAGAAQVRPRLLGPDLVYADTSPDGVRIRRIKLKW